MNNLEKIYRKAAEDSWVYRKYEEPYLSEDLFIDEAKQITADVAIQFGKFISGVMPQEAKQVQRENYPDYMEKLFELFIEKYYEQP
jgi:hypothetical protein